MEQIVVGGLIAVLGGIVGSFIQDRREHSRWVRAKRQEAHLGYLVLIDRHANNARIGQGPRSNAEIKSLLEELAQAVSALSLFGPETVLEAARTLRDLTGDYLASATEPDDFAVARSRFIVESRKALGIRTR